MSLQDQRIKLNAGINRDLGWHMEARLLISDLMVKFGVLWSHMDAYIEAF